MKCLCFLYFSVCFVALWWIFPWLLRGYSAPGGFAFAIGAMVGLRTSEAHHREVAVQTEESP